MGDKSHHPSPAPAEGVTNTPMLDLPGPALCPPTPPHEGPTRRLCRVQAVLLQRPSGHPCLGPQIFPGLKVVLPGSPGTAHTQGSLNPLPPGGPRHALPWATHPLPRAPPLPQEDFPSSSRGSALSPWEDRTIAKDSPHRGRCSAHSWETLVQGWPPGWEHGHSSHTLLGFQLQVQHLPTYVFGIYLSRPHFLVYKMEIIISPSRAAMQMRGKTLTHSRSSTNGSDSHLLSTSPVLKKRSYVADLYPGFLVQVHLNTLQAYLI